MAAEELDRQNPLFDGRLPVELRRPAQAERKEVCQLTLRVLTGLRTSAAGQRERLLHIEVTDEGDSFFLFTLDVGEEDFHELKRDQSLLVDFAAFPNKFIELVHCCLTKGASARTDAEPHFIARLETRAGGPSSAAQFSIVEANQFKELTHLSLQFRPGNDTSIKVYLAGRLRQTLRERDRASTSLASTEERLAEETKARRALEAELDRAASSREHELREVHAAHVSELATLREAMVREMEEAAQRHGKELRELQGGKDSAVDSLQRRLDESESRRQELSDQRHAHEASIRELTRKLEVLTAAAQEGDREKAELRGLNKELETAKFGLDKEVSKLQLRLAALKQQVADREEVLSKSTALQAAAEHAKAKVEESLELYKANCLTLQEKLEASVAEINKGNQIIQRIQAEYKQLKTKLKLKGDVLRQQERLLSDKDAAIADASRRLAQAADDRASLEEQLARAKKDLAAAHAKLEESNRLIESNQQVITWLNKEINEAQLGRGPYATATPSTAATTFTPLYQATPSPSGDETLRRYTTPSTPPPSSSYRRFGGALDVLAGIDAPAKSTLASYA